jgi:hypothetical protein
MMFTTAFTILCIAATQATAIPAKRDAGAITGSFVFASASLFAGG